MLRDTWCKLETLSTWKAKRQLPPSTLFWVLATTIPLITIVSTHLWLRTAYSGGVFHLQGFLEQYDSGIFRYRLLGRNAVLFIYRHLLGTFHDQPLVMPRDANATLLFYGSYVVLNAACFSLSNFLLLSLVSDKQRHISDLGLATYLYLTLMQTLAMAVVTPYDQLAYLLILTSLFAATISRTWIAFTLLAVAAIAGALTRETQFLVTPALFAAAIFSTSKQSKRFWIAGLLNLLLFGSVYIALRALVPGQKVISGVATYGGTWAPESLFVLVLLFYLSTSLAIRTYSDIRPTIALLVFSVPYILPILISGVFRELRLLIPILLAQTFVYVQLGAEEVNSTTAPLSPHTLGSVRTEVIDAGAD